MMEKEIQRKKKVLIDLTNYGSLTAGFGQIAANYAAAFSSMPIEDLHFVYLLRQKYMQEFGPNVTSVPVRRINKFFGSSSNLVVNSLSLYFQVNNYPFLFAFIN